MAQEIAIAAPPVIEKEPGNRRFPDGDLARLKIFYSGTGPFQTQLLLNKQVTVNRTSKPL